MYKKSLLSASIVLALTSTAYAEEYALFDEVVVSATRTEQQLEDVAASVSVVTEEDIDKTLSKDLGDVFQYTPGVSVETDSRHGIQGINIRGLGGNRVNILVDGVSQPSRYDSGYSFLQSSRVMTDTEMFKSVEIVKGSASSLYGSDGIAGIAAFQTKDPSDFVSDEKQLGGYVKLGYASDTNEFSESVALANKFGDLETLVAYTRRDGEEVDNFGTPDEQDSSSDNLLVKAQYQINDENRIELVGEYGKKQTETQLEKTGQTFLSGMDFSSMPPTFKMGLGNIEWDENYGDDDSKQTRLGFKHILEKDITIADKLVWGVAALKKDENGNTHRNGQITSVSPADPNIPTPDVPTGDDALRAEHKDYTYNEKAVQFDVQATKYIETASVQHTLVYGANYQTKDIENRNLTRNLIDNTDSTIFYQPNAEETRYGAFVQDEMLLLGEALRLTPGVRFDSFETKPDVTTEGIDPTVSYDKHSSSAVTGRLGAVYELTNELKTFGQISQGFRAPSFDELYYSYDGGSSYENRPNPQLEAEESITYEIGFRHNTDISSSEIAFYYSDFTNFIDHKVVEEGATDSDPDVYQYVNVDEAVIKGVEFGNTLNVSAVTGAFDGITSRFAIAYTQGEDGNGNALNSIEPWNAVLGLSYDAPQQNWGTSIQLSYIAKKSNSDLNLDGDNGGTTDQVENPSATVVDLTAYYVPVKDLTLRAGLFNVTDEKYWAWSDVRGRTELDLDESQAGRNWAITAKYEF